MYIENILQVHITYTSVKLFQQVWRSNQMWQNTLTTVYRIEQYLKIFQNNS